MLKKDKNLYPYRVFTSGGHAHVCYVPFEHVYDFWDHILDLRKTTDTLETCYIKGNDIYFLILEANSILAVDTPFDTQVPFTIEAHEEKLKINRTRHMRKKQDKAKQNRSVGQSVKKRRN